MSEYIRIPPDSTGKKIRHTEKLDVSISTTTVDLDSLNIGDIITDVSSGNSGVFTGWSKDVAEGDIDIHLANVTGDFTINGKISNNDLGEIGTIKSNGLLELYTPSVSIVDSDSPYQKQKIDKKGRSFVRFLEGDLNFDAFGRAQVSQKNVVDFLQFTYVDEGSNKFTDIELTGGTVTIEPQESCLLLSTTNQNGSKASRTTNQYYPYTPGIGSEVLFSLRTGDSGKENLIRRFGLFDDENGAFFELSGTTFSVVLRSSTSGSVLETRISQNEFNGSELLNQNIDDIVLDLTKYNLFFIDYQWLGVGNVRFGIYGPTGRITLHTFQNPNKNIFPWSRTGSLPLKLEQFNNGNVLSNSQMRMVCASIIKENNNSDYKGDKFTTIIEDLAVTGSTYSYVTSFRPKQTFNTVTNRRTVILTEIEAIVDGDPVLVSLLKNSTLTGATFTGNTENTLSSTDVDKDATNFTETYRDDVIAIPSGFTVKKFKDDIDKALVLNADGVTQPNLTFTAKCAKNSGSASLTMIIRWKEVS